MRIAKRAIALLAFAGLLAVSGRAAAREKKLLSRSLYIPIEFSLCDHLFDAVVYQDDQLVGRMPAKRIFQFTYYPDLERMAPDYVKVRVEGNYADGESFTAKLAVAPDGVHTAHAHKAMGSIEEFEKKLRRGRDVRYETKTIRLACPRYCSRKKAPVVAGGPGSPSN